MAHVISDSASVRVDDATAAIAVISGSVNSVALSGGQALIDDTGIGDSRHTVIEGLANATEITLNGYVDTTTEAIFAPLLDGTSVQKTVGIGLISGQFLNGESWPRDVSFGAGSGELQTWSCTFQAVNGLTRTSVAAT